MNTNKIQTILKFAMRMEKDAGDFYSYYLDKVKEDSTKKLFSELVGIERQHYNVLRKKFEELGFQDPPVSISWVVDNNFTAIDPHIISDNSDIIGDSESDSSDLTIIRMAYLIENDFALFYKNAAELVDDAAAKKVLTDLAEWEEQHRRLFYDRYQSMLKKYWSDISSIIFT